jgi:hypothetical protein
MRKLYHDKQGITLVEMLIAAFLSFLVAAASLHFYLSQHKSWLAQNDVSDIQQNVRASLNEIADQLRMAGYGTGTYPSFVVGTNALTVYAVRDSQVDTIGYFVGFGDYEGYSQYSNTPILFRRINKDRPEIYAEGVEALKVRQLTGTLFEIAITARSSNTDEGAVDLDGYRRRELTTRVRIRNIPS